MLARLTWLAEGVALSGELRCKPFSLPSKLLLLDAVGDGGGSPVLSPKYCGGDGLWRLVVDWFWPQYGPDVGECE